MASLPCNKMRLRPANVTVHDHHGVCVSDLDPEAYASFAKP